MRYLIPLLIGCAPVAYDPADTGSEAFPDRVLEGSITVANGLEIAALYGYTEITGSLTIEHDVTTVDDLEALYTVGGQLVIQSNRGLVDLDGLRDVVLGSSLKVHDNYELCQSEVDALAARVTAPDYLLTPNLDGC